MPDPKFFPAPAALSLAAVAELTGAALAEGTDPAATIGSVAPIDSAGPDDASFLTDKRDARRLAESRAGACFVTAAVAAAPEAQGRALLVAEAPQAAFVALARHLYPEPAVEPGISPAAQVDPGARIGAGCRIEPGAVIGPGAEIGDGCLVGAGAVIGPNVTVGAASRIGARVVLSHAILGARVVVHPGAAIGQDGFGYVPGPAGLVKVPQLGRVVIGDDVEIGANTTIDRGAGGDTEIGDGTKIDNLVQVAHNCRIGRHCALASHVGLSGSVTLGDFAQLGGKAGVADHVRIGRGARVAAGSGVMRDVPDGETHAGSPAQPVADWHRETVLLRRLRTRRGS